MINETTLFARTEIDLDKILLFIQMNAHHVRFIIDPALVVPVVKRLRAFAQEHPGSVVLEVVETDGETVRIFALGGAIAGAAAGFAVAGLPGAALGAAVGACAGSAAAHLRLSFEADLGGDTAILALV